MVALERRNCSLRDWAKGAIRLQGITHARQIALQLDDGCPAAAGSQSVAIGQRPPFGQGDQFVFFVRCAIKDGFTNFGRRASEVDIVVGDLVVLDGDDDIFVRKLGQNVVIAVGGLESALENSFGEPSV